MSEETTYSIEHAKSGRSSCKKCKEKIPKDEMRLGVSVPGNDFSLQSWYHPACFPLPRKLTKAGISVEEFVADMLRDDTDEHILQEKATEIVEAIKSKPAKKTAAAGGSEGKIAKIKARLAEAGDGEEGEPPKKKIKMTDQEQEEMEIYNMYAKVKNDELKDVLRWNHQLVSGTKDLLLVRIIDGQMRGRLGRCPLCEQGRIKISDASGETAICNGYYDEDMGTRISCSFSCPIAEAPRLHPWYTVEPTEEEVEEMKAAAGVASSPNTAPEFNNAASHLTKAAEALEWNLDTKEGVQKATAALVDICASDDGPKVDIPEDSKKALMEVGKLVAANRTMTAAEVMELVVTKFGFAEQKEQAAEKKQKHLSDICAVPANAAAMQAMLELQSLYFKEGNRNAGVSYGKVASAIKDLDFEITAENAKGLGGGKNKVPGIGKSSAAKIHELLATGTIEKLEEKRADAEGH